MRLAYLFVTTSLLVGCGTAPSEDESWDFADGKSDGNGALSYGALAQARIPASFDKTAAGLSVVDEDVMPPEVKAVRKQMAETRDYLDLFSYAYKKSHGDDLWDELRDQFDTGYERFGAFKDLYDRQGVATPDEAEYDGNEVVEKRTPLLNWVVWFNDAKVDARGYLASPSQSSLQQRDRKDLSPFFWGATKLEPAKSKSGLKNMAVLTRKLLELSLDDYDKVLDLRKIHKIENQEHFHDFRKRIRSIARMPGYFPEIVEDGTDITEDMAIVTEAVDRYGALNDKISRYASHTSNSLANEIADDWKVLRDWQQEQRLDKALDAIRDSIRH